jgi:hypothetical protein
VNAMGRVIPFKHRSSLTFALVAVTAALVAFVATMAFLNWKPGPAIQQPAIQQQNQVTILRPEPRSPVPIDVIDGDTVSAVTGRAAMTSAKGQRRPLSAFAAVPA